VAQTVATVAHRRRRRRLVSSIVQIVTCLVVLAGWELAASTVVDPFYYSKPSAIARRLVEWIVEGTTFGPPWTQIAAALEEAAAGFGIGAVLGVVLGILLGRTGWLSSVCGPFLRTANAVPRIVLAALFVIWFGLGMSSKVATVVVMVFFAVFFEAFDA